jgi:8-oxo-dGTP pyrophosphatase MutT (NUDIX family)
MSNQELTKELRIVTRAIAQKDLRTHLETTLKLNSDDLDAAMSAFENQAMRVNQVFSPILDTNIAKELSPDILKKAEGMIQYSHGDQQPEHNTQEGDNSLKHSQWVQVKLNTGQLVMFNPRQKVTLAYGQRINGGYEQPMIFEEGGVINTPYAVIDGVVHVLVIDEMRRDTITQGSETTIGLPGGFGSGEAAADKELEEEANVQSSQFAPQQLSPFGPQRSFVSSTGETREQDKDNGIEYGIHTYARYVPEKYIINDKANIYRMTPDTQVGIAEDPDLLETIKSVGAIPTRRNPRFIPLVDAMRQAKDGIVLASLSRLQVHLEEKGILLPQQTAEARRRSDDDVTEKIGRLQAEIDRLQEENNTLLLLNKLPEDRKANADRRWLMITKWARRIAVAGGIASLITATLPWWLTTATVTLGFSIAYTAAALLTGAGYGGVWKAADNLIKDVRR